MVEPPDKVQVFSPDWEDVDGERRDHIELDRLVGYECVPLRGAVAVALEMAQSDDHMAAIKAGTAKPRRVQFGVNPDGLLQLAAAFSEIRCRAKMRARYQQHQISKVAAHQRQRDDLFVIDQCRDLRALRLQQGRC